MRAILKTCSWSENDNDKLTMREREQLEEQHLLVLIAKMKAFALC
jgi:hypothetical protein